MNGLPFVHPPSPGPCIDTVVFLCYFYLAARSQKRRNQAAEAFPNPNE